MNKDEMLDNLIVKDNFYKERKELLITIRELENKIKKAYSELCEADSLIMNRKANYLINKRIIRAKQILKGDSNE